MKPDVLVHFADRIAQIGVYEGLWWRHVGAADLDGGSPDAIAVRLDDGTRAYVVGHCKTKSTFTRIRGRWEHGLIASYFDRYQLWTDQGYPIVVAFHEHRSDTLLWCEAAVLGCLDRHSIIDGVPHVFWDRDAFTISPCELART